MITNDPDIEARVIAGCIEEADVLDALPELEISDFYDYRNQAVFAAIRNLEEANRLRARRKEAMEPITIVAVDNYLLHHDRVRETHVAEKAGVTYLTKLVLESQPYGDDLSAACGDAIRLRVLRDHREQAAAVAAILGDEPAAAPVVVQVEAERAPDPRSDTGFLSMSTRVKGELEERKQWSVHAMNYHNAYIDDCLRAILPHDFILIGAETGLGKTDLALSIAMGNATHERPVAFFALEAEPRELERRTKFAWLSNTAHERGLPGRYELNYTDWLLCRCEDVVGPLNAECERWFDNQLGGLWTYYRGERFDQHDLKRQIMRVHKHVDLIVVDHLHYLDFEDDENENRAITNIVKTIRDVSLRIGKPVILVAHLKKKDERMRKIVPSLNDFHGTSNISKVVTQSITIARARKVKAPKWWLAPTYVSVLKDRRAGAPPYCALQFFNRKSRTYEEHYVLGELVKGDTDWEPVKPGDQPSWARCHRQLELEFV